MRVPRWVLLTLLGLAGLACHNLLEVDSPLSVPASALDNPALAPLLVQSAIGDFECALGNYVAGVASLSDEFAGSATPSQEQYDRRLTSTMLNQTGGCATTSGVSVDIYGPLQKARYQADDTYVRMQAWMDAAVPAPGKTVLLATVAAYAGYTYTILGEGFCQSAFDLGPPLTPRDVLDTAEQRFTTAAGLAQTAGNAELANFANVGLARVRLDLGKLPEAAAAAKLVSANYVRNATFSSDSPRRRNQVYVFNYGVLFGTVDARFRTLTVGGVADLRVPAVNSGRKGPDGLTQVWFSGKYTTDASPIPIATWEEAQLIIAEAEGGQSAVDAINRLRTKYALPLYPATGDSANVMKQVREERRRTLFLQGHRLNDMLRFNLPFDTGINGLNPKGQLYGDLTCFPLPYVETRNNPNFPH